MRVDKDDRYISEQPNKDSTPPLKLLGFLQDFPKRKLIILGLAIIIFLLLCLIIFYSSHKKTETPLTPPEVNGVTSTEETNDTIADEQNISEVNGNQIRGTDSIIETLSDNALNQSNTQLESFGNTDDSLDSPTNNQNKGYKANHHTATTSNGRAIASKTDTKKNNHNLVNSKNENVGLEKNIKIKNDRYVIQLSASKSLEGLKKFIKQNNITDYHIYQSKHQSGSWFVLIKGNYSSIDEANEALKSLPSALQKDKPWVKSGATINKEKVSK
ncbi:MULTISPECIES: SPOR domain-containing protein [unclassified Gilliamella]|uniref:SPOR domain-containing protein n=1 Tax=unclassified Gilliamella TaxID=2685620 RepID=UPI00130BE7BC|nr:MULTISPECIES: SPOR domain-containing protein [unclassified Gilliamella]MWP48640.1 hypothetical protein [Gilliamella sp. Lep-s35]MWP68701.1 hypothetical protein [Gilliamella sp. Lep-s5]MWP76630.1 hypothetical protein [Gilliamella sp. Lep-s21]